jgi:threonyl-tRNA synthetase
MHEIANRKYNITGRQVSKDEARKIFATNKFKLELIDEIKDNTVGIFTQGNFSDLCKGGHVSSTDKIKYFKLTGISGAYWRANREGTPLQRISGVAFDTKESYEKYIKKCEDAILYDHRRLGKQLDLFSFHDEAPSMPFFHHKGTQIYNKLIEHMRSLQTDYFELHTPLILHESLWKTSGHYDNYKDHMYFTQCDDQTYCVRPMNCPCAMLVYKERPHSYRELPLRLAEFGCDHRYELSGVTHGLMRVRYFTMDDAHIFCTQDQMESEVIKTLDLAGKAYAPFNFSKIKMAISTRPEKYIGAIELWDKATSALKTALERKNLNYIIQEGEGAFYGPKIEIKIEDNMGREWQCGTVQIDFFMPKNFGLEYIDSNQARKTPVVIHRAILGSMDRFMGILIEHFKGNFPFWLAPTQVRVLTITDNQKEYSREIYNSLIKAKLRVEFDDSGDQISAQIKKAQNDKIPFMIIIGAKEASTNTVSLRHHDGKQEFGLTCEELIKRAHELELSKI